MRIFLKTQLLVDSVTAVTSKRSTIRKFFGSRMPISDSVALEQRSTYILPTKAGLFLSGVLLLMMIGATNYQNNLAFMLTFLIASIGLVSIVFTFKNLQGLRFIKGPTDSVCAGENLHLRINIESQFEQTHSAIGVGLNKHDLYFCDVNSNFSNQIEIAIPTEQRGWFQLPRLIAISRFPFGLLHAWSWFKFASPVLVYPKPLQPPSETGSGQISDEEDSQYDRGQEELYGLKSYQQGEPISRIDWKAVAREKGIFSKEFVDYQSKDTVFSWNDFSGYPQENILSYLCYLVMQASHDNKEYALQLPNQTIAKNSGEHHLRECLTALATFGDD